AWVLALLTLRPGRRRAPPVAACAVIAGFGIAAAAWTWPIVETLARIPAIGQMLPLRFHEWIPLCAAALAAFELDRLGEDARERPSRALALIAGAAAFGAAAVLLFLRFRGTYAASGGLSAERRGLALLLAVLAVVAVVGIAAARARRPARVFAPALTA